MLQLTTVWGKLDQPFLDTRVHYDYDNAFFSFYARSGNRNGDLRSALGITGNHYVRWGERSGPPSYYTHHPFLVKALFQQYTRLVGTEEWASRSFYLAVSFGIAAGAYTVLRLATGSLAAALAGAATLVVIPLFACFQTCVKFEADGMLLAVWQLAALGFHLRSRSTRSLVACGLLGGLSVLAHWTAAAAVAVSALFLGWGAWRRRDPVRRRLLVATVVGAAAGLACLLGLVIWLRGGAGAYWSDLAGAFNYRSSGPAIGPTSWRARQWAYAQQNFGVPFLLIVATLASFLVGQWGWRRRSGRSSRPASGPEVDLLRLYFAATLLTACFWLLAFRQGSFVHSYWQYWFTLPAAAVVAAFLASLRGKRAAFVAGALGCALLIAYLHGASAVTYGEILRARLGVREDIAFLKSLRDDRFPRMVFIPVANHPLNEWFEGPLFEYYTDRPVVRFDFQTLNVGDKALFLRYKERDATFAPIAAQFGRRLANEKCGARLCAYDVLPALPAGG